MSQIRERCRNRWLDILTSLGVDSRFLRNKHGPCPNCGGDDRFRWDNQEGRGTYICSNCGAGDGFDLLCLLNRTWTFRDAAREVERIVGKCREREPAPELTVSARRAMLRECYARTRELQTAGPAWRYLDHSLAGCWPSFPVERLREGPNIPVSWDKRTGGARDAGRSCMVAVVTCPDDQPASLHRTYFDELVKADMAKPRLMMPGKYPPGSSVRLMPCADELGVAEGIETALAASWLHGIPVWAALNASGVKEFRFPESVRVRRIFADNDEKFAGQSAAYECARRAAHARGECTVSVHVTDAVGDDWRDVLIRQRANRRAGETC